MNRRDRRRAEAQRSSYEARLRKDAEEAAHTQPPSAIILPDDIKRDIAKMVQSIEWIMADGALGKHVLLARA
jgi:hypothetical protein